MKIVTIHQPDYIPWLGFFKKIMDSDICIFLDDVQYTKNDYRNRNRIRTSTGSMWLTIPVKADLNLMINQIKIDNSSDWIRKHKKSIELNYSKAEHFNEYWSFIESFYEEKFDLLIDMNLHCINNILKNLNIKTKIILSSELNIAGKKSERILNICKAMNADIYISGAGGRDYLQLEDFKKEKIEVKFQNFHHPTYKQCYDPFFPNMSTIDLILNEGQRSHSILSNAENF